MIMGVAAIFGMFAGTFYWFPKMFGRMMNETLGKIHFYLTFIGVYAIFTPMHFLGMAGNPRRYSDFTNVEYLANLMPVHKFMTQAAYFTAAAQIIFLINLFWSMKKGAKAPMNPWNSTSLEWTIPFAAALRQFRRRAPGGQSWSVRVQRARRAHGFHHADRPARRPFGA